MHGLTFLATEPRPIGWRGDKLLLIQGSKRNTIIHRVYVDIGSSTDIIYEDYFRLFPDRWKEGLKNVMGQLTRFMGHNLWPLVTIDLPFTPVSHYKARRKTMLIDFVVIWYQTEHNIILEWTTLFRFGAIQSTIHGIVKFNTTEGPGTILETLPREL